MMALLPLLLLSAALQPTPAPAPHWLGGLQISAGPGESVTSREGPDFYVHHVQMDGRTLFSAYHGTAPNVDAYRLQRFRRSCGAEFFRLWSRRSGPPRIEGYLMRVGVFATHVFGDAVTGTRQSLRAFERRIIIPRC